MRKSSNINPKTPIIIGTTEALSIALKENLPKLTSGEDINFMFEWDEPSYSEYKYPSVVLFNPDITYFNKMQTQMPIYKDKDKSTLTAKEVKPPIATKLIFTIKVLTADPDSDAILSTTFLKFSNQITELQVPLDKDKMEYAKVQLYWKRPTEFRTVDNIKIQIYDVQAWVWIEHLNYIKRHLISPEDDGINLQDEVVDNSYFRGKKIVTLSHTIKPNENIVYIVEETKGFPATGTIVFLDVDETFEYTSKTINSFTGEGKLKEYHFFGEKITYE